MLSWKSTGPKMMWCNIAILLLLGCFRVGVLETRNNQDDFSYHRPNEATTLQSRDDVRSHLKSACDIDAKQQCHSSILFEDTLGNEVALARLRQSEVCDIVLQSQQDKYFHRLVARGFYLTCYPGQHTEASNATAVREFMEHSFRRLFLSKSAPVCFKPHQQHQLAFGEDVGVVIQDGLNRLTLSYDSNHPAKCIATIASLRALLTDTNTYQNLNVTLFLGNLPLLGYDEKLVDEAIDWAASVTQSRGGATTAADVAYITGLFRETQSLQRTPLAPASYNFLSQYYRNRMTCLRNHYNNNQMLMPSCATALEEITAKLQGLEFRIGIPLAAYTFYVYLVLTLVALYRLQLPLRGMPETAAARKRRKFLHMLRDPVLRAHTRRKAELRGEPDIEQYMADLDARGQELIQEGAATDEDWKHTAAKEVAWKRTLAFMWNVRKACVGATVFSLLLFLFDTGADILELLDCLIVIACAHLGTFFCLPKSPFKHDEEAEMAPLDSAAEPLLDNTTNEVDNNA